MMSIIKKMINILIVEDNKFNLQIVEGMLSEVQNIFSSSSRSLLDAFEILEKQDFDVVLLDLNLPDSIHLDTLINMRKSFPLIPIVVITGEDSELGIKAVANGAQEFLIKGRFDKYGLERSIYYAIERKRIEDELRKAALAIDTMIDGVIISDIDGIITDVNRAAIRQSRLPKDDIVGKSLSDFLFSKDEIAKLERDLDRCISGERDVSSEYIIKSKSDQGTITSANFSLIKDYNANPEGIISVFRNISEQKRAEKLIISMYSELDQIFNAIPVGICIFNNDYCVDKFNKTFATLTSLSIEQIEGMKCQEFLKCKLCNTLDCTITRIFNGEMKIEQEIEFEYINKNNIICHVTAKPFFGTEENIIGVVMTFEDVTQHKEEEKIITQEKEKLAVTLKSIGDGVITTDENGKINMLNNIAEEITGWRVKESIGRDITDIYRITDKSGSIINDNLFKNFYRLKRAKSIKRETILVSKDGVRKIISENISKINDNNITIGYVIVFRDITEQKTSENQISLSQKLQSIGQLSAGVAHEINTPMQFIGDNAKFFKESFQNICDFFGDYFNLIATIESTRKIPFNMIRNLQKRERELDIGYLIDELPRAIDETLGGIDRVTELITALKSFTHSDVNEKQLSDINKAIESTVTISKNEWKYDAELELNLDPDLPLVMCSINEISQVILNLIINSSHAIHSVVEKENSEKGKITISTNSKDNFIYIIISDTGKGIPDEIADKIFDPFFTTKEVGKGTGQGLAIAHNIIVNNHKGRIIVDSEVDKGTTFTLSLPVKV
ncbi:MAG: PAS domain S-box protein [Spirochaetota bacterium]|nr:PAS domain S-box protein [Spirochaetota bacterium]